MSAFGVMQSYYSHGFLDNESASAISWIGSLQQFLDLALAALGGHLLDRGYFRHVVVTGSVLFNLCLFMLSLAQPHHYYQVFLTQGLGMGAGVGLIYLPTSAVASQHFKKYKTFAIGLVMSGGSLGGFAFSIALNQLLNGSLSFGWAIRVTAFVATAPLLLGNLLIFEPPRHQTLLSPVPNEGSTPSRVEAETESSEAVYDSEQTLDVQPTPINATPFWDRNYIFMLALGFSIGLGMWFPSSFVQSYAQQHNIDRQLAFYALAIMNVSSGVGRILPNWFGDRWGPLDIYVICLFCAGALEFAMLGCSTAYGLVLFTLSYGFFLGTTVSLYLPVVSLLSKDGVDVGKRMGVALFPVGVASLIGNPVNGALVGKNSAWWKGVTLASVAMLTGASLALILRLSRLRGPKRHSD
ncbi:uncharacterized protein FIBRA_05015 [Fibroporia radiculosa]|uniref:Major facilitator superfamily (MFS) profile domain-containing protein n=1 Tax=Fibroporia radiculosa TaxID=599839 RepID=J4IAH1_9APHY|nr:uncharacterized protein FIBRA_05015 [Fibroporia radiculosa]CCM02901.1 predicted protein [Fibroporia radiculosa]